MGGDEGEGEGAGAGAGVEVFRVRVSLERYYSDERAWCYMCVRGARPVRSLARRLRRAFRLPRPFALLASGHLLPPDEPLALLRPDDAVHVVPTAWSEHAAPDSNGGGVADGRGAPSPPSGEDEGDTALPLPPTDATSDLEESKQRALRLLEAYGAPRRRRRRVRRRRVPHAVLGQLGSEGEEGGPVESQRATPPAESQRATPPAESQRATPPAESQRTDPPVASQRATPPAESQRSTPPTETQHAAGSAPLAVVRNGAACARAPRVVRPLHAPPAPRLH